MYEQHFGLSKRPFVHQAVGDDVFIGPQTATLVKRAQRALEEPDAVMCISGPVGCGKSTVVARTLSAVGWQHTIIHIGRIKLGTDETIEFLLRELGLKQMPAGTIRKLAVFRGLLDKLREKRIRLFVVVEDAARLGNEALAELEALTASDSGVSAGANLVLMSEEALKSTLREPGLARLAQRTHLHYELRPLTAAELQGYVAHGLRHAGGEIASVFEDGSLETLHALSGGVPRIVNNLIGSALATASETGAPRIDRQMLIRVAADEYGIELDDVALAEPQAVAPSVEDANKEIATAAEPEPAANPTELELAASPTELEPAASPTEPELAASLAEPELAASPTELELPASPTELELPASPTELELPASPTEPEPAASLPEPEFSVDPADLGQETATSIVEPETPEPAAESEAIPELIQDTSPGLAALDSGEFAIPELIQDTLPDLEALAPEVAATRPPEPIEPVEPPAADIPTLVAETERDPTFAELEPDLDALEQAMAAAQGGRNDDALPVLTPATSAEPEPADETPDVPRITLDDSIRRKIDLAEAEAAAAQPEASVDEPDPVTHDDTEPTDSAAEPAEAEQEELERIAAQLANVTSLEDIDDAMAETLFGAEISMIAAQVVSNPPSQASEPPPASEPVELSLVETSAGMEAPASDPTPANAMEEEFRELYGDGSEEVSIETQSNGGMDLSASQRLATVRALNAGKGPAPAAEPSRAKPEPEPIEDQINTSITQTLKALKLEDIEEVSEDPPQKSGFFSRFRKS